MHYMFVLYMLVLTIQFAIVCEVGRVGSNCDVYCHYPNYGKDCQLRCHCSKEYCNLATGCEVSSKNTIPNPTEEIESSNKISPKIAVNECDIGRTRPNCEAICRYPNYGMHCQFLCNCTQEEDCNPAYGCQNNLISRNVFKSTPPEDISSTDTTVQVTEKG